MNSCLDYKSKELVELAKQVGVESTPAFADKVGTLMDKLNTSLTGVKEQISDKVKSGVINIYAGTGENADLSNFATRPFEYNGKKFNSVEHAFQYSKGEFYNINEIDESENVTPEDFRKIVNNHLEDILNAKTAAEAKKLGKKDIGVGFENALWDEQSSEIMKNLLKESFAQNPDALQKLLSTGNAELTHTQDKSKWGKEFPKLLMEVREELSNKLTHIIKPGVSELFESNPELSNIGTQEQYSQYLDTIFPDSKVKDIVYHGSSQFGFDKFSKEKLGEFTKANSAKLGFFFSNNLENSFAYTDNVQKDISFGNEGQVEGAEGTFGLSQIDSLIEDLDKGRSFVDSEIRNREYLVKSTSKSGGISYGIPFKTKEEALEDYKNDDWNYDPNAKIEIIENLNYGKYKYSKVDGLKDKPVVYYREELGKKNNKITISEKEYTDALNKRKDFLLKERTEYIKEQSKNRVYSILLNSKNLKEFDDKGNEWREQTYVDRINQTLSENKDGLVIKNTYDPLLNDVYVVFEPEQIHILGTNQDIEGFKKHITDLRTGESTLPTVGQLKEYIDNNKPSENIKIEGNKTKVVPKGLAYAEVRLPAWSKKFFEKHFLDENGEVDFNKINEMMPDVMDMVGYRIPTEDKYSMLPLKVVGFLPSNNGGAVMLPAEITKIAGSDFDVDKLYVMYKNFIAKRNKDGETTLSVEKYLDNNNSTRDERKLAYANRLPEAYKIRAKYKELIAANKETTNRSMAAYKSQIAKLVATKELQEDEINSLYEHNKLLREQLQLVQENLYDLADELTMLEDIRPEDVAIMQMLSGEDPRTPEYKDKIQAEYNSVKANRDLINADLQITSDKLKEVSDGKIKKAAISAKSDKKYAKLQELLDSRKELYSKRDNEISNLISDEKFDALSVSEQNTKTARDNRIIDINLGVLRSSSTLESILTPGGYDYLKEEVVPTITGRISSGTKATDIFNADHVDTMTVQNVAGRDLKGIAASHNKFRALIEHSNLKLVVPALFDGVVFTDLSGKDRGFKSADGRSLVRNIAEQLAAAVDNGKDPLLDKINYNEHTAGVISMLLCVGVPPMTVYAFMNQKPVRDAIRDVRLGKESSFRDALAKKYKEVTSDDFKAKRGESYTQPWQLSQKQLLHQINDNSPKWVEGITRSMLVYLNLAGDVNDLMKATKADTKGMGKFIEEGIVTMRNVNNAYLIETIEGVGEFLSGNSSNKLTNAFTEEGIRKPLNKIFSKLVPYNNQLFIDIKDRISELLPGNTELSAEESRNVNMHIIQYLLSNTTYYSTERGTFIQTMPFRFVYLKKEFGDKLAENRLFNSMRPMPLNNEISFEVLAFDNDMASSEESREEISQNWSQLYNSKVDEKDLQAMYIRTGIKEADMSDIKVFFESDKFKNLSKEDRDLVYNKLISTFADDLFKYSFLTTGNMFTPKSINTLMPISDYINLENGGLQDLLYDVLDDRAYLLENMANREELVDQYFRNYAYSGKVVPRLVKTKAPKDNHIKKTASSLSFNMKEVDKRFIISLGMGITEPVKYITVKDTVLGLFKLESYDSNSALYKRINRLGAKGQLYEFGNGIVNSVIPTNNFTNQEEVSEDRNNNCKNTTYVKHLSE